MTSPSQSTIVIITVTFMALALLIFLVWMCFHKAFRTRARVHDPEAQAHPGNGPELGSEPLPPSPTTIPLDLPWTAFDAENCYGFDANPDLNLDYGDNCLICHETMDGRLTIGKISQCKHAFHRDCIFRWYQAQRNTGQPYSCPVCRDISQNKIIITKVLQL
jgi:hypothetical protein